ncbi:hypothetical protein EC957_008981 [Mortierella hygrophila]|uniref:Uncharacterized protein n=1 Tax=Mortierella hygrophila TaxID=979708 RepID=A0A9P6K5K0_9FUNG|nr:hypothetical protein EC957_008981 [Mortierella hygrophila]
MTGVSDFSAKVSRHVSQRLYTSIAPLTEANLYRHTITSPPSQDAKLKHILGYVELQRELIALEEDLYRSVTDKGHWYNTTNNNNSYTNNNIELHSSQLAPHNKDTQYPDDETIDQFDLIYSQSLPQQQPAALAHRRSLTSSYHQRKNSSPNPYTSPQQQQRHTPPPLPSPALYMQQHHQQLNQSRPAQQQQSTAGTPAQQRHLDNIPDGLDPAMALPRALPRTKMTHHDQTLYRDSFYSGIGQETDWRQLEELDPDSLAGIHLYGDTSDLQPHATSQQQQQQRQKQPSPAAASSPLNKYPTYEFTPDPAPRNSDWQHERHLQQLQQQAILRQLQSPDDEDKDDEDEAKVQMATRLHRRQHSIAQAQQLQFEQQHQRQLVSPPPTFIEEEKKTGRFSSRFSFLTRRRQHSQLQPQHQRSDSMPNASKEPWLNDFGNKSGGPDRLNTLGHRRSGNQLVVATAGGGGGASPLPLSLSGGPGATTPIEEEQEQVQEEGFPVKNKSRVKQMFRDVFGISKKKCQSPDLAFRDISLPSTHIRSSSTPAHQHQQLYGHPQHLDPSINSQYHYSAAVVQRKGLITPVSRPDTAQSSYRNNNDNTSNNRNQNNNSNNRSRARESLVDPVQQLGFQKMEFDEDCDLLGGGGAFPEGQNAYGQTSLTPPPASSVLRHSTSPHRSFLSGSAEYEPVLITASAANTMFQQQQPQGGAAVGGRTNRTSGPPSQMTNTSPTSKDYVDSGCDSTGGLEQPCTTTASNATTLNQHHTTNTNTNTNTTATATIKGGSIYSQQQPQQPYLYSSPVIGGGQHQKSLSYDYDQAMTMSTYDNGPTIVSMAQVQKVDLEGLRQSHGHYSVHHHHHQTPPSHSHHLGMVAVESPFA